MASEVDICNLALAHLGDNATIASIDPPEGSAQAEHCQRFYPIARDTLLEMHSWNFATKRVRLTEIVESGAYSKSTEWDYVYQLPNDTLQIIDVFKEGVTDDYSEPGASDYVPQPYQTEVMHNGNKIIRTDVPDAEMRYVATISDTTKFSPLFVMALSWQLASLLAGPIMKGEVGAAEAKRAAQMMSVYLGEARKSDAAQRNIKPEHKVPWMTGR